MRLLLLLHRLLGREAGEGKLVLLLLPVVVVLVVVLGVRVVVVGVGVRVVDGGAVAEVLDLQFCETGGGFLDGALYFGHLCREG